MGALSFAPGVLAVAGSRVVPSESVPLVRSALLGLVRPGVRFAVGCCSGVDALALSSLPAGALAVLAAFGPVSPPWQARRYSAPGSWSGSALAEVADAMLSGASVTWWAGGGPSVPLAVRLAKRTAAVIAGASGGLLVFPASPVSRGSFLAASLAAVRGLPVVAVPLGFPGSALPLVGPGSWVPHGGSAFRWASAQEGFSF